ncbi:MAG: lysine--tRNA ligase [Chloroflexi bacterium]|nr:lysine--tRNA ligase [Chloroflexota bacterium]MCI0578614.1 lysine--tRNA ligase [Chloroflexota bacterium]MCI0647373.1 lysine--tRNA ligase [Chloroflexota bacterium]MCI0727833.1 lysine--tRNA ligase [Chloroflexota bacterium]
MAWEPTPLEEQRLSKLARLAEAGIDPYPPRAARSHTTAEAIAAFLAGEGQDTPPGVTVTVCGRLVSLRDMGKTIFGHIEDGSGKLQLFVRREEVGEEPHRIFQKLLDLGDFVQATGLMFRTKMGEVSLRVKEWRLLSKAITPLPVVKEQEVDGRLVRYSAFADLDERFRQRYADLAVNPEVREVFRLRARLISALRRFLDDNGFLEVETPVMQPLYGGAAARPFTTYHNQLKQELYLRISFELYLKRLLVGGFERVYEIGRDFRNEGVDATHNPEFTQLEFYAAYWDYHDVMAFTERMIAYAAEAVLGTATISFQGQTINLAAPWPRLPLREAIKQFAEIDYMEYRTAESLAAATRQMGGHAPPGATWGKLVDGLLGDYVQPRLIQPTFIIEYPRDISPLAKICPLGKSDDLELKEYKQLHTERFEFFIGGMEMGNAFTELNDPQEQRRRFEEMQRLYAAGDEEAHPIDEDYLRAMRYGMPPNGGFGVGVDRLAMLFTDRTTIREVLLFPHLRERE